MEQYPIPQFIEQEGKIAFFISFRQFFYLVAAGVICFILYFTLPFFIFIILGPAIFLGAAALAFISINGMPLLDILMNSIGFASGVKDYMWKKKESPYPFRSVKKAKIKKIDEGPVLKAQTSRLRKAHTDVELRGK